VYQSPSHIHQIWAVRCASRSKTTKICCTASAITVLEFHSCGRFPSNQSNIGFRCSCPPFIQSEFNFDRAYCHIHIVLNGSRWTLTRGYVAHQINSSRSVDLIGSAKGNQSLRKRRTLGRNDRPPFVSVRFERFRDGLPPASQRDLRQAP
jgi:hypothetical protein